MSHPHYTINIYTTQKGIIFPNALLQEKDRGKSTIYLQALKHIKHKCVENKLTFNHEI